MNDPEAKGKNQQDTAGCQQEAWPGGGAVQLVGEVESAVDLSLRSFRNEAEIHAINHALRGTGWNRKRAARLLSISYRSLLYKIRRHNIVPTVDQS
jgi:transcriptional regulator with GAF, ATPase, and Fis domain